MEGFVAGRNTAYMSNLTHVDKALEHHHSLQLVLG